MTVEYHEDLNEVATRIGGKDWFLGCDHCQFEHVRVSYDAEHAKLSIRCAFADELLWEIAVAEIKYVGDDEAFKGSAEIDWWHVFLKTMIVFYDAARGIVVIGYAESDKNVCEIVPARRPQAEADPAVLVNE